jgi:hypothetical protein
MEKLDVRLLVRFYLETPHTTFGLTIFDSHFDVNESTKTFRKYYLFYI